MKKFKARGTFSIEFIAEDEDDAIWRLKHVHLQDANNVDVDELREIT